MPASLQALEPQFLLTCARTGLSDYADDVAEYLTDNTGRMRASITPQAFALRFAVSTEDAQFVLAYIHAFHSAVYDSLLLNHNHQ